MKKLLFIESNTTGTGMLALGQAKELGYHPVFLTNNPARYPELKSYDSEIIECNTNHLEEMVQSIESLLNRKEIKGLTTTSEFYIEAAAKLNEHFGLHGNSFSVVRKVRNKAEIRHLLKNHPLLYQPTFFTVQSAEDAVKLKGHIPYPCIVKPVDDSGSNLVKQCVSFSEVADQVRSIAAATHNVRGQATSPTILIEEFVEGQEYSVECFSYEGVHTVMGVTQKSVGEGPHFVETGHLFPAHLHAEQVEVLNQGALEILTAAGWRFGPSHLEVKIKGGKLFLVEFNGRLAGGMIPELIRHSTNTDLLKEQLKCAVGIKPSLQTETIAVSGIRHLVPGSAGQIHFAEKDLKTEFKGIKSWQLRVQQGQVVEKAVNAYGRIGYIIATGKTEEAVKRLLHDGEKALMVTIKEEVTV